MHGQDGVLVHADVAVFELVIPQIEGLGAAVEARGLPPRHRSSLRKASKNKTHAHPLIGSAQNGRIRISRAWILYQHRPRGAPRRS